MTDKLNNLIETSTPEEGGYYRAGFHALWDLGLTPGNLYLIRPLSELGFNESEIEALLDGSLLAPFCIIRDSGSPTFMSAAAVFRSNHAKLYKNPASAK